MNFLKAAFKLFKLWPEKPGQKNVLNVSVKRIHQKPSKTKRRERKRQRLARRITRRNKKGKRT